MSNSRHKDGWGSILVTLIDVILCLFCLTRFACFHCRRLFSKFYSFYHLTRSLSDDAWNGIHMYASWRIISPQHWDHTAQWGLIRSSSSWVPLCTALSSGVWNGFEWFIRKRIKASCHALNWQSPFTLPTSTYLHIALDTQDHKISTSPIHKFLCNFDT